MATLRPMFDYIIVGGGSAGSVLANRLSARSANQVLLCEAGEDTPDGKVPEDILDNRASRAFGNTRFLWNELAVTTQVISHNQPGAPRPRLVKYEQARVLGGGSSINGQLANRGAPADYDDWDARGATGWNWDAVLPFFRRLERDMDFDGPLHGSQGRIPVRRIFPELWPQHAKAVARAFEAAGFQYIADQNEGFEDGYYPVAISNLYDRRVSAAIGYLGSTIRSRPNLTIRTGTHVQALLFDGTRCTGIRANVDGTVQEFQAKEVVLCCGAIHSPAHLLRAGIGPAGHLRQQGIAVLASVPGVGQGLMDHPSVSVASFVRPDARDDRPGVRPLFIGLRFSSGLADAPSGDMALTVSTKSSAHAIGGQIGAMTMWVNKTYSQTGQVQLASADWRDEPQVDFNLLSDQRDLLRLSDAFRRVLALHASPDLQAAVSDPFAASFSDRVRKVGEASLKNKLLTAVGAKLLDGPAPLRRWMIRNFIQSGVDAATLMRDSEALDSFIRHAAVGVWHASCSCRMGAADDPMAVTDPTGLVRAVQGLRVVDASIFPQVPCANTNFPTMMAAEKIADQMLSR